MMQTQQKNTTIQNTTTIPRVITGAIISFLILAPLATLSIELLIELLKAGKQNGGGEIFLLPILLGLVGVPLAITLPRFIIGTARKGHEQYQTSSWRKLYVTTRLIFTLLGIVIIAGTVLPFLYLIFAR
jgi:hypothetical protein